ncbi:MAG: type II toxin-antitoxin system VapB family antitoxin [Acidobacteriota bacterium]
MKTTIDIADALFDAAREKARREGTTLRAVVEEGLRAVLGRRPPGRPFRLRRVTFRGKGLNPDLEGRGWEAVRDRSYEGRGA